MKVRIKEISKKDNIYFKIQVRRFLRWKTMSVVSSLETAKQEVGKLKAMDEYNNPKIQWIFTYAFPTDMSSISLDYTSTDELEFTVTFVFSQMRIRNILYDNIKNTQTLS